MLSLPEPIRQRLAGEFRFATEQMAESADLNSQLYFFSALFGEVQRALNLHWSADLALMHSVLQYAHQTIQGRIQALNAGDISVGLPKGFPDALNQIADQFATLFEEGEIDETRLYGLLTRLGELTFAMTGNGYYLYVKGTIKI